MAFGNQKEEDRIQAEIDRTEAEIDSLYAEIGKEYYMNSREDPRSEEMESCFRSVDERRAEIQDLTDQIRALRGITTCGSCGADILVTDTFCSNCGARIISEITLSSVGGICPNCGHKVKEGQLFCSTCGAKVNISETAGTEAGADDDISGETDDEMIKIEKTIVLSPVNRKKETAASEENSSGTAGSDIVGYCTNCGEPIQEGMMFCMFCGTPVESGSSDA